MDARSVDVCDEADGGRHHLAPVLAVGSHGRGPRPPGDLAALARGLGTSPARRLGQIAEEDEGEGAATDGRASPLPSSLGVR